MSSGTSSRSRIPDSPWRNCARVLGATEPLHAEAGSLLTLSCILEPVSRDLFGTSRSYSLGVANGLQLSITDLFSRSYSFRSEYLLAYILTSQRSYLILPV